MDLIVGGLDDAMSQASAKIDAIQSELNSTINRICRAGRGRTGPPLPPGQRRGAPRSPPGRAPPQDPPSPRAEQVGSAYEESDQIEFMGKMLELQGKDPETVAGLKSLAGLTQDQAEASSAGSAAPRGPPLL